MAATTSGYNRSYMAAIDPASRSQQADNSANPRIHAGEFLDLFGDEYTRKVFETITDQPRCGRSVAEAANVSRPTAYRRLNALKDAGLIRTQMSISADGYHREQFEAVTTSFTISMDEDGLKAKPGPD